MKIKHDYFVGEQCCYGQLMISKDSLSMLSRRQCWLQQTERSEWKLISLVDVAFDDSDKIELDFVSNDKEFLYCTQWDWKADGTCRQIEVGIDADMCMDMTALPGKIVDAKPNTFLRLVVSLQNGNYEKMAVTELKFSTKILYWEYWLIPRNGNYNRNLELEIIGDEECSFDQCEVVDCPLSKPVIAFRSSVPLKLQEMGQEKIFLYERIPLGMRRLLMHNLPLPVPGRVPFNKENTVVNIVYF